MKFNSFFPAALAATGISVAVAVMPAQAASLTTSAYCTGTSATSDSSCDPGEGTNYGFKIDLVEVDNDTLQWTLTNTSTAVNPEALIDQFWFSTNPNLTLGTDFTISGLSPSGWSISQTPTTGAGSNVQFDFTGDSTTPNARLGNNDVLKFNIDFASTFAGQNLLSYFFNSEEDAGRGIGGGDESGQVAVSFQQLGTNGEGSDLLVSNWIQGSTPPPPQDVPEPAATAALGFFALGSLGVLKKKQSARA